METSSIKKQIQKKFGSVSQFARAVGVKPSEMHNRILRIEMNGGKQHNSLTRAEQDLNELQKLVDETKGSTDVVTSVDVAKIKSAIFAQYESIDEFVQKSGGGECGFSTQTVWRILRGDHKKKSVAYQAIVKALQIK